MLPGETIWHHGEPLRVDMPAVLQRAAAGPNPAAQSGHDEPAGGGLAQVARERLVVAQGALAALVGVAFGLGLGALALGLEAGELGDRASYYLDPGRAERGLPAP